MCAERHNDLVDCDPLVEAERHGAALRAILDADDVRDDDPRIRTPIEDSKYGYPCNPLSTPPNVDNASVRHVTGNQ